MMFFVSLAAACRIMQYHDRATGLVHFPCRTAGCTALVEQQDFAVLTLLIWVAKTKDRSVWPTVWRCDAHLPDMVSGSGGRPRRGTGARRLSPQTTMAV